MKDKKTLILVGVGALIVLAVTGVTYAWLQASISGNKNASSVVVKSGKSTKTNKNRKGLEVGYVAGLVICRDEFGKLYATNSICRGEF